MVSKEPPKSPAGASAANGETPPQAGKAASKPARKPAAALPVKPRTKKPRESRMAEGNLQATARVIAVQDDLVQIECLGAVVVDGIHRRLVLIQLSQSAAESRVQRA